MSDDKANSPLDKLHVFCFEQATVLKRQHDDGMLLHVLSSYPCSHALPLVGDSGMEDLVHFQVGSMSVHIGVPN